MTKKNVRPGRIEITEEMKAFRATKEVLPVLITSIREGIKSITCAIEADPEITEGLNRTEVLFLTMNGVPQKYFKYDQTHN